VSSYIHLNPARAGLINAERPELKSYRWSSFPACCGEAEAPAWLPKGTVLEWQGWDWARSRDRGAYERLMQKWAEVCWREASLPEEDREKDEEFEAVRRGWYLGGEEFREELEAMIEKTLKGKRRTSYGGEALRKHDEAEGRRLLEWGLARIGSTLEEARRMKQSDPRKQGLCWLVKSHTMAKDEWLQNALTMGDRSNISRAVSAYRKAETRDIKAWRKQLHVCTD
jgi:putative transposase